LNGSVSTQSIKFRLHFSRLSVVSVVLFYLDRHKWWKLPKLSRKTKHIIRQSDWEKGNVVIQEFVSLLYFLVTLTLFKGVASSSETSGKFLALCHSQAVSYWTDSLIQDMS
jgi:hypothetical protein